MTQITMEICFQEEVIACVVVERFLDLPITPEHIRGRGRVQEADEQLMIRVEQQKNGVVIS